MQILLTLALLAGDLTTLTPAQEIQILRRQVALLNKIIELQQTQLSTAVRRQEVEAVSKQMQGELETLSRGLKPGCKINTDTVKIDCEEIK